jgi:hypothetical protein
MRRNLLDQVRRFLEKDVPLVGAHGDAPLPEILNQLGHLFLGNVLNSLRFKGAGFMKLNRLRWLTWLTMLMAGFLLPGVAIADSSPAAPTSAAPTPAAPIINQLSAASGDVQAAYTGQLDPGLCETSHRLQISRAGQIVFDQMLDAEIGICRSHEGGLKVQDLDGDQEPEVVLDLFSGGAHCCGFSQIYYYDASARQYSSIIQFWGHTDQSNLQDLDGDGIPEFASFDSRFAYRFASFADSGFPLQIWQYRQGSMIDVTRNFPQRVYSDAYLYWNFYIEARQTGREVKGLLAAYLADKYLLGEAADGWQRVQQAYQGSDRQEFFTKLLSFLQEAGYGVQPVDASQNSDPSQAATTAQALLDPSGFLAADHINTNHSNREVWRSVPGTNIASETATDAGFWAVRLDTMIRTGDAINFDVNANREYGRYAANCRTRMMTRILQGQVDREGQIVAATRTQEEFLSADTSPQRRLVLDYACSQT